MTDNLTNLYKDPLSIVLPWCHNLDLFVNTDSVSESVNSRTGTIAFTTTTSCMTSMTVMVVMLLLFLILILKTPKMAVPVQGIPMVPDSHWFLGHTNVLIRDFRDSWKKLCYDHANEEGLCSFWNFNRPAVTVNRVEHARAVLNNSSIKPRMDHLRKHIKMILGENSLIWFVGKEWKYHRSLYSKGLNGKPLAAMLEPIHDVAVTLVKAINAKIDNKQQGSHSIKMDVTKLIQMAIFDVSSKIFFGMADESKCCEKLKQSAFSEKAIFVEEDMKRRIASPLNPAARFYNFPCAQNKKYMESIKFIRSTLQKMIQKRRLALIETSSSSSGDKGIDFITTLLRAIDEDPDNHSKKEEEVDNLIIDTLLTTHMASFDSSTITLVYILYCLASNPEAELKCLEEIERISSKSVCSGRLNPDDLPYCNAVITETIRLYPANVAIGRTLDKPLQLGKTVIPAGNDVLIPYWYIMRDEKNFARALEFLPERWVKQAQDGSWVERSSSTDDKTTKNDDDSSVTVSEKCQEDENMKADTVGSVTRSKDFVPAANGQAFIGFSVGARNCVGLRLARKQICIILVELLRHLKFELIPGFEVNPKTIGVGLKHDGELPMIISKRYKDSDKFVHE